MPETIVLFHSVLGLRPAVQSFAQSLRDFGHTVHTPDLFDGQVFDDLEEGARYRDRVGIPDLIERAQESVGELPQELVYAGFSMGTAPASLLAATRPGARAAVLLSGAVPPAMLGIEQWPGVPVQVHYALRDPWIDTAGIEEFAQFVRQSDARCDLVSYDLSGHLFADKDLADYDPEAAESMLSRVARFLDRLT